MHSKNTKKFLDIPIDPDETLADPLEVPCYPYGVTEPESGSSNVVTNRKGIISEIFPETFATLYKIIADISAGFDCNRKGRIVLEYDPQKGKVSVLTMMEYDEALLKEQEDEDWRAFLRR